MAPPQTEGQSSMDLCQSQFLACRAESTDATSAEEEREREKEKGGREGGDGMRGGGECVASYQLPVNSLVGERGKEGEKRGGNGQQGREREGSEENKKGRGKRERKGRDGGRNE